MDTNSGLSDFARLREVIRYSRLSVVDFCKSIGYSSGFYYEIKRGKPSREHISKNIASAIVSVYKEINYDWLMYGTGDMLKQPNQKAAAKISNVPSVATVMNSQSGCEDMMKKIYELYDKIVELTKQIAELQTENNYLRNHHDNSTQ